MSELLLTGEFEHTIDEKNRLFIPNKFRSQLDPELYGTELCLSMGPNGILSLYPEKYFRKAVLAGVSNIKAADDAVAYERLSYGLTNKVELDRQGRFLINETLKKRANLGNEVTLVGVGDHFEIWNREEWERYLSENAPAYMQQAARARQENLEKQNQKLEAT